MKPTPETTITIAGAGLAGSLLSLLLAQRGWRVEVLEKRHDQRRAGYEGGRSINLALAERGLHALGQAGLAEAVLAHAVMMRGRMVHRPDGQAQLQRYGRDDSEVIWSIHRGELNHLLLDAAEAAGVRLRFETQISAIDFDARRMQLLERDGADHGERRSECAFDVLLGTDGAGSALRRAMGAHAPLGERVERLDHGYKELRIPPAADGSYRIEPHALHLWPRGSYMCIALPDAQRSFTVTLFLPNTDQAVAALSGTGDPVPADASFQALAEPAAAAAFFAREFPGALSLMPDFERDWLEHPSSRLATLYLDRWHLGGDAVLLGDAAHAMVPFHGQGMNCAFEDCVALIRHIDEARDFAEAFAGFEAERRPNAQAIQAMALENYLEMRGRVDDADYLLQRELEALLTARHPRRFVSRYAMVTFRRVPYATAYARGAVQRQLLVDATHGLSRIEQVDLNAVDAQVQAQLDELDA